MTIESATYISDLNTANPGSNDLKSEGDDHIRLVKSTLKTTFPNVTGAMTLTQAQLNALGTGGAPTFTGITTTTGNAILGSTSASTLNVGAGGLIKDASGNVGIGITPAATYGATGTVWAAGSFVANSTQFNVHNTVGAPYEFVHRGSQGFRWYVTPSLVGLLLDSSGNATPGITNTQTMGATALRWSNVYGVLGNFSGAVTAASFSGSLSGNISQFTNDSGYATSTGVVAAAGTLTGSSLAANVVNSSLTSIAPNATDGTYELGFKGLPAASVTTGGFVASDRGKCVYATAGVTIPNSTMAAGDVVTIINTTASPITLTAGVAVLRQAGTANTGNRTLAGYGVASVVFVSAVLTFISGVGLT